MNKKFKCPLCGRKYVDKDAVLTHMNSYHEDEIPKDRSVGEFYYNLTKGKMEGSCIVCGNSTSFNEKTQKYHRLCSNPKCRLKFRNEFKKRMMGKYNKVSLLDDPEQQRKMLANRKISGKYTFKRHIGKPLSYTGSYELDFLKLCDLVLDLDPLDIESPASMTFYYDYNGEKKFYIPDFYIGEFNLLVEIKDGGDNPNKHHKIQEIDKVKEKLKDDVMRTQKKFNYIKIVNKDYGYFTRFIMEYRNNDSEKQYIIIPE